MFEIGDIVVGVSKGQYVYTGYGSVCQVVEMLGRDRMRVEIIKSAPQHCPAGGQCSVMTKYFELQTPASPCISDEDFEKLFA